MSKFDNYILRIFTEAGPQPQQQGEEDLSEENPEGPQGGPSPEGEEGMPPEGEDGLEEELQPEAPTYPEEIILAKLAIRALHFNTKSKKLHTLKLRDGNEEIPFEKISDYFERTKQIPKILGFVEWAMNRYETSSSNWMNKIEPNVLTQIQELNKELPDEQKLDNNNRLDWTRIILNCLLRGSPNFNVNIADVNETTIREIHNLLSQTFANDSRGMFANISDIRGPATF
jgi:hypothetical protein